MFFCQLQDDEKTFLYFKKFVQEIKDKTILKIGNEIQGLELRKHFNTNQIPADNVMAEIDWTNKNAEGMRLYLNTIEAVHFVWICTGKTWNDIDYSDFTYIRNNLNRAVKSGVAEKIIASIREV